MINYDFLRGTSLLTALIFSSAIGCNATSREPNPQWVSDFQKADAIVVQKNGHERSISDSATIDRLKGVYKNSKWTPYWHTLPGNLGDRTLELCDGENRLRIFCYMGELWVTGTKDSNRHTAELTEGDREWIESIFAQVTETVETPTE